MHKIIAGIVFITLSSFSLNTLADDKKQTICHNGNSISVAQSALAAHQKHGDKMTPCGQNGDKPSKPQYMSAVVMMRCEAQDDGVVVVSASSSPELDIIVGDDCAAELAILLDEKFIIRSITSGSAENGDDDLSLYTDYLLLGKVRVEDDEDEASIDD